MSTVQAAVPDHTAIRVALWRALHVQVDSQPHVLNDEIGLQFANPPPGWQQRPDMHPHGTRGYRAAIVARARFIEDLVLEQAERGIHQYIILGAGLDSFAQRLPKSASRLRIFEVDQSKMQVWKERRLLELGFGISENLRLVPVDFEAGESWLKKLIEHGFDINQPATIASTGVSMYLTKEANLATMRQTAMLASGSTLAMTFLLPLERIAAEERPQHQMVYERARAAGTPFISFFELPEIKALARDAGFKNAEHISRDAMIERYFMGRTDGLLPASGEEILLAST